MTALTKSKLDWPASPNIHAFVTTREGGYSDGKYSTLNLASHVNDNLFTVNRNRSLLRDSFPYDLSFQWLNQIHSSSVVKIESSGKQQKCDGLVCAVSGIACCILTADCLPIFFTNKSGTEIAIAHAGWRGICNGIIENLVNAMDSEPEDIVSYLGPAIGPCHYEVGMDLKSKFKESKVFRKLWNDIEKCFCSINGSNKYFLDLYQATRVILTSLGVNQIYGGNECTYCQKDKYFSFRRDGNTGRMASVIFMEP